MSLKAGTCELPRFAFHCLAILPGGDFKFELRDGEEIRVPETCAPEDLLFFPAHHRLRAVLPDPTTLVDIPTKGRTGGAGGSCFRLFLPTKHLETVSMDYPEDERESLMRAYVGRPTKNFRLLARMLRLEFNQDASGGRQMLDALTDALLVELLRLLHSSRLSSLHFASLTDEQISKALKLVQSSVDGSIRLGDIAAQLSLPPSTFTRRFKATFGVTPSEHLLELRLERVKALLVDTDLSIARISYECGFSSQAHLTTRFSEAFGLTPAKYRRAHQRR